jgi:hypothetical protein
MIEGKRWKVEKKEDGKVRRCEVGKKQDCVIRIKL